MITTSYHHENYGTRRAMTRLMTNRERIEPAGPLTPFFTAVALLDLYARPWSGIALKRAGHAVARAENLIHARNGVRVHIVERPSK